MTPNPRLTAQRLTAPHPYTNPDDWEAHGRPYAVIATQEALDAHQHALAKLHWLYSSACEDVAQIDKQRRLFPNATKASIARERTTRRYAKLLYDALTHALTDMNADAQRHEFNNILAAATGETL